MKILIHGFGSYVMFYYELIKYSIKIDSGIDWSMLLPTYHYKKIFEDLLGSDNVFYLHNEDYILYEKDTLANYQGNIYKDIECDKKTIKSKMSLEQEKNALYTYNVYKKYMLKLMPDFILFSHIESHEGMILKSIAEELGIQIIIPTHTRLLGESFFSDDEREVLPKYSYTNDLYVQKAKRLLEEFYAGKIRSFNIPCQLLNKSGCIPDLFSRNIWERIFLFIYQINKEKKNLCFDEFRYRFLNNLPFIRDSIWKLRELYNSKYYNIKDVNELPSKYIYYPLQYTPESSINIPAPYFVDQMRVIDALRMSMPSDMVLVVKEHPSCIGIRDGAFVKHLLKKAGVRVANYKIDSRELIKRSCLTASVTGTASLEAFMYRVPSIVFGGGFFSEFIGGKTKLDLNTLKETIDRCINQKISMKFVEESLAKIYSVSYPFILTAPADLDTYSRITMSKTNIENFYFALKMHISKIDDGRLR